MALDKLVKSSGNDKKDEPSTDSTADPIPEPDKPTGSEEEEKEPEKKDEPSPETNPESDKPTDPKKKEKELEEKEEKDPEEKFKKEEKGGFVEWYKNNLVVSIPLTILFSAYFIQIIICMIIWEIKQRKDMSRNEANGICLDFGLEGINDDFKKALGGSKNIKPFFGWWEGFTKEGRFEVSSESKVYTITYSGLKRIGINALAAVTLAEYGWRAPKQEELY